MEEINSETIIKSLLLSGFKKIDSLLFTYTLGAIAPLLPRLGLIFKDNEFSTSFKGIIAYENTIIKLKDDYNLDTILYRIEDYAIKIRDTFKPNIKLLELIKNIDFSSIIKKKAEDYNISSIDDTNIRFFSQKEIDHLLDEGIINRSICSTI